MSIGKAQLILFAEDFRGASRFKVRKALQVAKAHDWAGVSRQSELAAKLWLYAVSGIRM
jgi:hypothetical protein